METTQSFPILQFVLGRNLSRGFFWEFSRVWAPVCDVVCFAACRTLRERSWNSEGKLKSKLTKIIMMIATQYKTRLYQITEKSQFFTHNSIICSGEFVTWCRSQLLCCQFCSKQRNMAAKALWGERSEIFYSMWKKGWNEFLKAFLKRGVCNVSFVSTVFSR